MICFGKWKCLKSINMSIILYKYLFLCVYRKGCLCFKNTMRTGYLDCENTEMHNIFGKFHWQEARSLWMWHERILFNYYLLFHLADVRVRISRVKVFLFVCQNYQFGRRISHAEKKEVCIWTLSKNGENSRFFFFVWMQNKVLIRYGYSHVIDKNWSFPSKHCFCTKRNWFVIR